MDRYRPLELILIALLIVTICLAILFVPIHP